MSAHPPSASGPAPGGATIVVAASSGSLGIGSDGGLPWNVPADMAYFRRVTSAVASGGGPSGDDGAAPPRRAMNAVVMGRRTWESIPARFRPLAGRINVVLSRRSAPEGNDAGNDGGAPTIRAGSLSAAMFELGRLEGAGAFSVGEIFVIGGASVYEEALAVPGLVRKILLTEISGPGVSDVPPAEKFDRFFPALRTDEWETRPALHPTAEDGTASDGTCAKSGLGYKFLEMVRRDAGGATTTGASAAASPNPEEMQYLGLCRSIIDGGVRRPDRTGTGTLSQFGASMRFSLRNGTMPLLTTKRTFWRGVAEELLWFVAGSTNANLLAERDIHIWDGNGSREFLDGRGLTQREVGDLGPVYGFQWRHFGAAYTDMHADYRGKGVDQLADCIHKIKTNPTDRRIIMSAWNPADLDQMALPPCHMFCQFYVDTVAGELSCQMYQRSADMGLGVPFNVASYALLTHMVAHVTGLTPGDFVHVIGDAHVYVDHLGALEEQMTRTPRPFPKLVLRRDVEDIDSFKYEDFEIVGYNPHKAIKMKMAV